MTILTANDIIISSINKTKNMQKTTKNITNSLFKLRTLVLLVGAVSIVGTSVVAHADKFDAQIRALSDQNSSSQSQVSNLQSQASSYQDAISKLQAQIDSIQASLAANQTKQADLQAQIEAAKVKIAQQKAYLGEDIKAMYVDGGLSTIEQLASSNNLSDYIDKEEYRTTVQNKVDSIIKEIAVLQVKMQQQKQEVEVLIASEKQQNDQLGSSQSEQQGLLSYNEGQQAAFNTQISANNGKIADLRRQQIAANAQFIGAPGSGYACGGGYPGRWCNIAQDSVLDSWGMFNRECVSYTAFRVAASGRVMPNWGGRGNANQWDDDAEAAGIPVDGNPQAGDVAIKNSQPYGHAMYVEHLNSNGTIHISQYNAGYDGLYSEKDISPGGLLFIHFP